VQGQIRAATTQGDNIAWASQPGMIRTYGSGSGNSSTASSALLKAFKLYSADNMVQTSSASLTTEDAPASTWATDKAVWTDLNAPVTVTYNGTDTVQFPIIDPAVIDSVTGLSANSTTGLSVVTGNTTARRLPMPVRWLYITQNGSLIAATGTGNTTTISGANATTNPIIGRIAFWTDDETSKININTAAGDLRPQDLGNSGNSTEGSFWDSPKNATPFEYEFALRQPLKNEFQRFPGHPATVSLTSVLGKLSRPEIASIAPRINSGGSLGGTVKTVVGNGTFASGTAITPDSDRLYSSIDELAFTQSRTASILSPSAINTYGFLLTTASRAPELNLFGKPRVSLWPLTTTNSTVYDTLINRCATMGNFTYSITRTLSNNSTFDYSENARNRQIYSYLQSLTGNLTPGFGNGTFVNKYPSVNIGGTSISQRDQILTEMVDYIRCINIRDTTSNSTFTTRRAATGVTEGGGQVNPLQIGNTMGFGRMNTISEAALIFMATQASNSTTTGNVTSTHQAIGMKAMLVFEFFCPALGYPYINPGMKLTFTPATSLTVDIVPYVFNSNEEYVYGDVGNKGTLYGGGNGPALGLTHKLPDGNPWTKSTTSADARNRIGFITTATIPLSGSSNGTLGESFNFGGLSGILTISTSDGTSTGVVHQTIGLNFPSATLPAPMLSPIMDPTTRVKQVLSATSFDGKYEHLIFPEDTVISLEPNGPLTSGGNPTWGDFRIVSMLKNVPDSVFVPQRRWLTGSFALSAPTLSQATLTLSGNTTQSGNITTPRLSYANKAHSLRTGDNKGYLGTQSGNLSLYPNSGTDSNGSWSGSNSIVSLQFLSSSSARYYRSLSNTTYTSGSEVMVGSGNYTTLFFAAGNYTGANVKANPDYPVGIPYTAAQIDFDTGMGVIRDGPYICYPDGSSAMVNNIANVPYFAASSLDDIENPSTFSPNRQVASAVQFGSLPAGFNPWRTLLFRPGNMTSSLHPSVNNSPKDYLLLDLFWMPIVEPYAISEPSSTAGRINMNYQILPFTNITRTSSLRACLDSVMLSAVSSAIPANLDKYKNTGNYTTNPNSRYRLSSNETLTFFDSRFTGGDIFKSPAEICDIPLVPVGSTASTVNTFWDDKLVTGDNLRESPYKHLYPLLTTKSNTYTVHFRVQALKKVPSTSATVWDETKDKVVGEYRGSTTIERYINPNDTSIPDFAPTLAPGPSPAPTPVPGNLEGYYKWRVLNNRQFAP
jgi:uncharacterized protein (TIGR02600 family)